MQITPRGKNLQFQTNYRTLSNYSPLQHTTFIFYRFKALETWAKCQTFSKNGLNHNSCLKSVEKAK